ncbi:MAG: 16S rRNA (uracil(1498)-N(3))-methyltransferase [Ardenticatenaceae bacterium]|nr:16S rRNA (uracil(1498)-N(3))-methyltransferase [Ardenticatenaceae bacterium]MCB9445322.1 16S rRNA (uracil(1498)-N(3))-methyltransferase [Ardenticatenaceae bacterium]
MHRFFVKEFHDNQVVFAPEQAHQITAVLRMEPGQPVVVLDNAGWEFDAVLADVGRKRVTAVIQHQRPVTTEPASQLILYQSLLKRDNFEWVLQKGTELGISRFVPLITDRTVARPPKKTDRWQRILTEAAEQSRRGRIPELAEPMALGQAVTNLPPHYVGLIPWEEEAAGSIGEFIGGKRGTAVALFIGPEGGFTAEEISLAQQHNIHPITLGQRILRAETAAVTAVALTLYELGEMKRDT